ncbi:MAG: hypothetical protein M5R36_05095 [Deltaproteobacteria bacterium]|nr:hypothetical protein [Deltaproteobacteria bacterium]
MRNLFADAARAALELRSTDPNSLVSHYVLGYIHLRQGHIDQAREELSAAASSGRLPHSMSDRARELLAVLEERSAP